MDFIIDFFKAVFIERDKTKIKDSIVTIAVVIIALWIVNSYNKINDGIEANNKKFDNVGNYRVVVVSLTDSIFSIKSDEFTEDAYEKINDVIRMVQELDEKRRQEINYLAKYKNKSYEEIMDILKLNEERWEFTVKNKRAMSMESDMIMMESIDMEVEEPEPIVMESIIIEEEFEEEGFMTLEMASEPMDTTMEMIPEEPAAMAHNSEKKKFFLVRFVNKIVKPKDEVKNDTIN